jgi:hypothetical protein
LAVDIAWLSLKGNGSPLAPIITLEDEERRKDINNSKVHANQITYFRDFTDNCSRQELFVDCDVYERNADEHHIALDFFASFMLDIATQKKAELQKIMGREDGTCDVDILSRVLMKHNVCKTIWEARLGIVPALIAQEFKLRDMPEPDIGLG